MGFFSRFFGKDTIKMEDVKPEIKEETPFVSPEEQKAKVCPPQIDQSEKVASSPFLDECEPEDQK